MPADVQRVEPGLIYMVQLCDAPLEKPAAPDSLRRAATTQPAVPAPTTT